MAHYSRDDVAAALRSVGLRAGDTVFSHSNIGFFGLPEGERSSENAFATILAAFFDVIGETGTLVVPTFTYSFPQGKIFDPDHTPSDCGIFTELLRRHPQACRSEDPCVSVAAIGAKARQLTENAPQNSYCEDSFFARFKRVGGVICNLNFDAGSTYLHYVERCLGIPYRFDKTFKGVVQKNGVAEERASTIWVRYVSSNQTCAQFESFDRLAREDNLFKVSAVGRGFVGAISAADAFELLVRTLPVRPWLLTQADLSGIKPVLIPE